jgi:hypothetical protein
LGGDERDSFLACTVIYIHSDHTSAFAGERKGRSDLERDGLVNLSTWNGKEALSLLPRLLSLAGTCQVLPRGRNRLSGGAILRQPDVAGFQVAVDDAVAVGKLQTAASRDPNLQRLLKRRAMVGGFSISPSTSPPPHQLDHHVRLAILVSELEYGDDVLMLRDGPSPSLRS